MMLNRVKWIVPALAVSLGLVDLAKAQTPIPLLNGSFETPVTVYDPNNGITEGMDFFVIDTPTENAAFAWGHGADVGVQPGGQFSAPPATDLNQIAFLGAGQGFTNIFQDILANPLFGNPLVESYTFSIDLATRGGSFTSTIAVGIQDLVGGPTNINAVDATTLNQTAFQTFSVTLDASTLLAGESIRVFLDKRAGNALIVADNARLVANLVPEPASFALITLGGLGVCMVVRRHRSRN